MGIKYRLQECAAERFKRVQYPRMTRVIDEQKPSIPFGTRLSLFVIGSGSVIIGLLVLAFLLFFVLPAFFD
jgi:hypothetical protein